MKKSIKKTNETRPLPMGKRPAEHLPPTSALC